MSAHKDPRSAFGGLARLIAVPLLMCSSFSLCVHVRFDVPLWWAAWIPVTALAVVLAVLSEIFDPLFAVTPGAPDRSQP